MKPKNKAKRLAIRIQAYNDLPNKKGHRKPGSLSGRK
jgi:hypothetical protein